MKKFLSKALNINEGEHGRVFLSMFIFLVVMGGIILGRGARDSLFLKNVGIKYLPYMFVLNAFFVVVVSIVYSAFIDKVDRTRFMVVSTALYAGVTVGMRALLFLHMAPLPMKLLFTGCYVTVQILWLIGLMQFWTFMGDVFDMRESKRLFPIVGMGGLMGMVVLGLGGKYITKAIGTENLFLVWAGMHGLAIFLIITLHKKYIKPRAAAEKAKPKAKPKPGKKPSQWQEFKEGFAYIKDVRLLRTLVLINLGLWVVFTIVEYEFNKTMNQTYPTKDELTAFLGMFRAGAGFLCLVVQLTLTQRLVSRLGVGRVIAFHPLFMGGATLFLAAKFGYASAFTAKFGDHVLLYTLQDSSYQMMYNPIPVEKRGRARAFVEGYVKPISMGIAGVILILSSLFFSTQIMCAIAVAFALVWIYASLRINADYVKALTDNLSAPDLSLRAESLSHIAKLGSADNLKALRGVIQSGDPEMAVFALEMIAKMKTAEALPDVRSVLTHANNRIRAAAVDTLRALDDRESLPEFIRLMNDSSGQVRRQAIHAVGHLGGDDVIPYLTPLLQDPKEKVRLEALAAIIRTGGLDGILTGAEMLKKLLESSKVKERLQGLDVLRTIHIKYFTPMLLEMAADPDPDVRLHSLQALVKVKDQRAADMFIAALSNHKTAHFARKGLAGLDEKALPVLQQAVNTSTDIEIRSQALKIIGKIKSPEVPGILVRALEDNEPDIRYAALSALNLYSLGAADKEKFKDSFLKYIHNEIRHVYTLRGAAAFLEFKEKKAAAPILLITLEQLAMDGLNRTFKALALVLDRMAARGIWVKLKSDDPKVKPIAIEALDNIAPKDITRLLTPLFEERKAEDALALSRTVAGQDAFSLVSLYEKFSRDTSSWLRGCAAYGIVQAGSPKELEPLLQTLRNDADPFVRETANMPGPAGAETALTEVKHMLLTMEKILFLKTVSLFADMSGKELRALADIVEEAEFKTGDVIFSEDDPGDDLHIIVRGNVQVLRGDASNEVVLATLGERDCLGEMAILDDEPRSATARAADDCLTLKLHRDEFRELIRDHPEVAFGVFRVFTRRLRKTNVEQEEAHRPIQGSV